MTEISLDSIKSLREQIPEHNIMAPFVLALLDGYLELSERIIVLESNQTHMSDNVEVLFRMNKTIKTRMEENERKRRMRKGPKTEEQIEKIDEYLVKNPKKRGTFVELRAVLGCSKSRFSNILAACRERYHILLNAHDRRRKLLQLKPNI